MSVDRRIELNVSVPNYTGQGTGQGAGQGAGPQTQADPQAQARFEQLLKASEVQADSPAQPDVPTPAPTSPLTAPPVPWGWPGPGALSSHSATAPAAAPALMQEVATGIERLMVGDGSSGNRQVRIELKDELLPGVSVTVQETDGRVQVDFICSNEDSRLRLNAALPTNAHTLAQRLRRDVLMRVQSDDDEYPCLQETLAHAG